MPVYNIVTAAHHCYEITDDHNFFIGQLNYPVWLSGKGHAITNDGIRYDISFHGLLRQRMIVEKEGEILAEMKYLWGSRIEISFNNDGSLLFKRKSIWSSAYVILASFGEVATLEAEFNWRKLSFNYTVRVSDNRLPGEVDLLLPFLMTYCVKYIREEC